MGIKDAINEYRAQGRSWMGQLLLNIQRSAYLLKACYQLCIAPVKGSYQCLLPGKANPYHGREDYVTANIYYIWYCTQDKGDWQEK